MNAPPGIVRQPKGTVLVREGETTADGMYILLQGEAIVYKNYQTPEQIVVETIGQSGYFGEMSLFLNKWSPVTVVAKSDVTMITVTRKTAFTIFSRQPELAFAIMESMCRKLDAVTQPVLPVQPKAPVAPVPEKPVVNEPAPQKPSGKSSLFPEGHGSYVLPINNANSECLYDNEISCPICGQKFHTPGVIASRLRRESVDSDLRARYKDFEPLYYDVTTCPACFYSALTETFGEASKRIAQRLGEELEPYRNGLAIKSGMERDTFAVFAGYYLALICAPVCTDNHRLTEAGLWQKLGRLYSDLGDKAMNEYAAKKSLEGYIFSYQNYDLSDKQMQQICYLVGDFYQKLGDLESARNYFYMAKTNRGGNSVMVRQADIRLDEIKELMKNK